MKILKYILITISAIAVFLLLTPFIIFIVLHYWIITPEYLTQVTKQAIHEYTHLQFDCRSIELEYLNSWPSVSIAINDGKINIPVQQDTIFTSGNVSFKKLYGNIQLSELLKHKKIQLENIHLQHANSDWNIGKQMPNIIKKKSSGPLKEKISFSVDQINVTNADINIYSLKNKEHFQLQETSIIINGDFITKNPSCAIKVNCEKVVFPAFGESVSLSLIGKCKANKQLKEITFHDTSLWINQFPFQLCGSVSKEENATILDLGFDLLASDLKEIFDFIPKEHFPSKNDYLITGKTTVNGQIKGKLNTSSKPDIKLKCMVDNGSFYKKGIKQGIDTISLCMKINYLQQYPDSCYVAIENTKIRGLNSYLEVESLISNLQDTPFINADFKGFLDFDYIGKELVRAETTKLKGKVKSNLSLAANLKDLQQCNLHRIWADGEFTANSLEVRNPQHNLNIFISGTEANIRYKKNKSNFIKQNEVLATNAKIDTLKICYDKSIDINLSKLNLRSNTSLNKNETPLTTHLDCKSFLADLGELRSISAKDLKIHAGTQNIAITSKKSETACVINAKQFKYLDKKGQNVLSLNKAEFITELRPNSHNEWDVKGMMNFENSQIYTSYYPTIINVKNAQLSFNNNQLSFNHLKLNIGDSDCLISGILTNNSQKDKPLLEGTLHILSDHINYDELKDIFLHEKMAREEMKILNSQNLRFDQLEAIISKSSSKKVKGRAFHIPKGVQFNLLLNIDNMNYEEVELHQVNGDVVIKDQKIYSQLKTRTNLGKAQLEALYDSSDRDNLKLLFDLNLQDVLLAQIQNGIPTMSTLFPLVKSMDGLMDCHLTVASQLDEQMRPILPNTTAACSLEGQNLSLSNNEIMDNIAKKLKFKNKKETIIKHISSNLILKDNVIEVIPFQMIWDRYEAIIGGTHTTDHNYNYHITMLKSIIPIDFGITLSGKPDDFHYKLGKCQYKELYKDGGAQHNQNTRDKLSNIRRTITKHINL